MLPEAGAGAKPPFAGLALVRLLPGVCAAVLHVVPLPNEVLPAGEAGEGPLPDVAAHVYAQVVLLDEALAALRAQVRARQLEANVPVDLVRLEIAGGSEGFAANVAEERLHTGVCSQVHGQLALLRVGFVAEVALEPPDLLVDLHVRFQSGRFFKFFKANITGGLFGFLAVICVNLFYVSA